jgi:hypothetical protein
MDCIHQLLLGRSPTLERPSDLPERASIANIGGVGIVVFEALGQLVRLAQDLL